VITAGLGAVLSMRTPRIFVASEQAEAGIDIPSNNKIDFIPRRELLFDVFN
jgi:hypothetical protein